jgi:hypothetical protein
MTQKMSKVMQHKSINDQILEAREEVERAIDEKLALTKEEIMHSVDLILGEKMLTGREAIMDVLERAAVDTDFMSMLAENPEDALRGRGLTAEEKAAISSGDIRRIERWVGKLTPSQSRWLLARLQQQR